MLNRLARMFICHMWTPQGSKEDRAVPTLRLGRKVTQCVELGVPPSATFQGHLRVVSPRGSEEDASPHGPPLFTLHGSFVVGSWSVPWMS